MARRKTLTAPLPKLFKRGKKGIYYFRLMINEKDMWLSTRTSDLDMAKKKCAAILEASSEAEILSKDEKSVPQLSKRVASAIVENILGTDAKSIPIQNIENEWMSLKRSREEISTSTKKFYSTIFRRFIAWCESQKIQFLEEVSNEHAILYANHLWKRAITPRTFNAHIKGLSQLFETIDGKRGLPNRNPFNKSNVERISLSGDNTTSHMALEPEQLSLVIAKAAEKGVDYRDLIICGASSGLRLKDAIHLRWDHIVDGFVELVPFKTQKTGHTARIPVSRTFDSMLRKRKESDTSGSEFVFPALVERYAGNSKPINDTLRSIFAEALGEDETREAPGAHRDRHTSIYSFHSLRSTMMSLLASKHVSIRDAKRIMCWTSYEMIRLYEKELERARGEADVRARKMIDNIDELNFELPECIVKLAPTKESLEKLIDSYSNIAIGRIYGVSEAAIRKQLKKHGLTRSKRIESSELSEEDMNKIREKLAGK